MEHRTAGLLRKAAPVLVDRILPRLDHRIEGSRRPFSRPELLRPHVDSRTWAWTHYGVFVPRLPAPLRYLNTMTFIGATGTVCFDNDYLARPDARRTATVLSSTAAPGHHHYRAYDTRTDCRFAADGSRLAWGEDLVIEADHPEYRLRADYGGFGADLTITTTPQVSYFVRTPIYDHLSLLATYRGTVTDGAERVEVDGLCTVEYARCVTPQALFRRPVSPRWKLPVDFFTYHVINLDERTQLLLTDVRAAGATACRLAHLRSLDEAATVFQDVSVEVTPREEPEIDPQGRAMRVPRAFRWTVRDGDEQVAMLDGTVETPLRYGHGRGYVGAYSFEGAFRSRAVSGTGYFEWVDCEDR
ncbi:hypothetical protein DMC64_35550 [Amycolatopsis sp. WAC 04197]|uniref:DUF6670 family protein n=1 Tax=Amycolatopsis sp. WAC 04197 TaxID=2203199 RepID=UPI000F7A9C1A|nr:DUF6670 family protein [Amycolatopsis sp. WAC 04197]RSN40235.1 hypothetical protein DMC64_35550 [Amycolatopsis sp. WAC 04197]